MNDNNWKKYSLGLAVVFEKLKRFFPGTHELAVLSVLFILNLLESFSPFKMELLDRPVYQMTFFVVSLLAIYSIIRQINIKRERPVPVKSVTRLRFLKVFTFLAIINMGLMI